MSKWTDIRDSIEGEVSKVKVDESVKQSVTQHLYDDIMPSARRLGDGFAEAVKEQAKSETGWCKVRDLIVLPGIIQGGLWLTEKALKLIIKETTGVDVQGA